MINAQPPVYRPEDHVLELWDSLLCRRALGWTETVVSCHKVFPTGSFSALTFLCNYPTGDLLVGVWNNGLKQENIMLFSNYFISAWICSIIFYKKYLKICKSEIKIPITWCCFFQVGLDIILQQSYNIVLRR